MVRLIPADQNAHAALLLSWRQQPDVARFMYSQKLISAADHERWFAALAGDLSRRYWIVEHQNRPVGSVYLTEVDRENLRAMFGMYVADEGARVVGVGAAAEYLAIDEALGPMGLEKVSCEVFAVNAAALRLHARMGFTNEGLFRRHARYDGAWVDVHRLSILREEWVKIRTTLVVALRKLLGASVAPLT